LGGGLIWTTNHQVLAKNLVTKKPSFNQVFFFFLMFCFPNCLILYFLGEFSNKVAKLVKFTPEKTQHLSKEKIPKNKQKKKNGFD